MNTTGLGVLNTANSGATYQNEETTGIASLNVAPPEPLRVPPQLAPDPNILNGRAANAPAPALMAVEVQRVDSTPAPVNYQEELNRIGRSAAEDAAKAKKKIKELKTQFDTLVKSMTALATAVKGNCAAIELSAANDSVHAPRPVRTLAAGNAQQPAPAVVSTPPLRQELLPPPGWLDADEGDETFPFKDQTAERLKQQRPRPPITPNYAFGSKEVNDLIASLNA